MKTKSILALVTLALAGCPGGDPDFSLQNFESCDALEDAIKDQAREEIDFQYRWRWPWEGGSIGIPLGASAPDMAREGGGLVTGRTHSDTNVQVEGVDEPDLVETDGTHIYAIAGDQLIVTRAWPAAEAEELGRVAIEGMPQGMMLRRADQRIAVISQLWGERPSPVSGHQARFSNTRPMAKIALIDISNPAQPTAVREVYVDGQLMDARIVENRLYVASQNVTPPAAVASAPGRFEGYAAIDDTTVTDWLPMRLDSVREGSTWTASEEGAVSCGAVYVSERRAGTSMFTLSSLDLTDPTAAIVGTSLLGFVQAVYANHRSFYAVGIEADEGALWESVDPVQESIVHRFDITGGLATPAYVASGEVEGVVLNQFSMDEKDDRLRIATNLRSNTTGMSSSVHVLEVSGAELRTVGRVDDIAPGEMIFAVRFVGDTGYVVTFMQIDPLFTVDLSDPTLPRVRGELEIPGFSNYLHPMDDSHLLAIGMAGTMGGWVEDVQISIFDVGNLDAPAAQSQLRLQGTGWSEAQQNHHAFNYFAQQSVLVVPVADHQAGGSRMVVVHAVPGEPLVELGRLSQEAVLTGEGGDEWCSEFRRSVIIEDVLYAHSNAGLTISSLSEPATVLKSLPFAGVKTCAGMGWWGGAEDGFR